MKYIVLVPDGVADHAYEELQGKTPLEASRIPNLNFFAKNGCVGLAKTVPDSMEPGSDVGNLSILGYNSKEYYTGRAPIEAASMGIKLKEGEVAFRMNFVTEADGKLVDYSAGHISTQESKVLVDYLSKKLSNDIVRFYPGVSYRHIAVIKDRLGRQGLSASCDPPHNIMGQNINDHWPTGPGDAYLKKLMLDARLLLQDHEINHVRLDLKENPANMIWFWGQGVTPQLESFHERFGLKGSLISAVDLLRGIANLTGLEIIEVPGITGYLDTNYQGKAQYGLDSLKEKDFIFIHVEATDEAGHEGNLKGKIQAVEDFDYHVAGAVKKYCEENPDTRVLIVPDHPTSCKTRTHMRGAVPFIMFGKGIEPNGIESYNEVQAQASDMRFDDGYKMMPYLVQNQTLGKTKKRK
ncbi:MAG: cofactor-independent phosphoglycerate mutase [Omnitrophica bacterium GWA2_50_21]|nr:MAG: cofactor-independent phosphoglycerate mutase [Omnitrophica bacterium GWA2_50_21]